MLCVCPFIFCFPFTAAAPCDHHLLICGGTNHAAISKKQRKNSLVVSSNLCKTTADCSLIVVFISSKISLLLPNGASWNKILGSPLLKKWLTDFTRFRKSI